MEEDRNFKRHCVWSAKKRWENVGCVCSTKAKSGRGNKIFPREKKEEGKGEISFFVWFVPSSPQPLFPPGIIYRPIKTGEGGREALFLVGQETLYYMCRLLGSMTFPLDTHREALIHKFFIKKCFFETPCLP